VFDVGAGTVLDLDNFIEASGSPPAKSTSFPTSSGKTWFDYYFELSSSSISVPYTTDSVTYGDVTERTSYNQNFDELPLVETPPGFPTTDCTRTFENVHYDWDTVQLLDDGVTESDCTRQEVNVSSGDGRAGYNSDPADNITPYYASGYRSIIDIYDNYTENIIIDGVTSEEYAVGIDIKLAQRQDYSIIGSLGGCTSSETKELDITGTLSFEYRGYDGTLIADSSVTHACHIDLPKIIMGTPERIPLHTGSYSEYTCSYNGIFGFHLMSPSVIPWDLWSLTLRVGSMGIYTLTGGTFWDYKIDNLDNLSDADKALVNFYPTAPVAPGGYGVFALALSGEDDDLVPHDTVMQVGVGALVLEYENVPEIDVSEAVSFGACYQYMDNVKSENLGEAIKDVIEAEFLRLIDIGYEPDNTSIRATPTFKIYKRKNL